jgi:hypothetical protein
MVGGEGNAHLSVFSGRGARTQTYRRNLALGTHPLGFSLASAEPMEGDEWRNEVCNTK